MQVARVPMLGTSRGPRPLANRKHVFVALQTTAVCVASSVASVVLNRCSGVWQSACAGMGDAGTSDAGAM